MNLVNSAYYESIQALINPFVPFLPAVLRSIEQAKCKMNRTSFAEEIACKDGEATKTGSLSAVTNLGAMLKM